MAILRPEEVFTPARLPLGESNVYATRAEPEERLTRFVRRHQVPVVYGEYGVGKTTLVRRSFSHEENEGRLVYIPSADGQALQSILKRVLEQFGYTVDTEVTTTSEFTGDIGFNVLVAKGGGSGTRSTATKNELIVQTPTDLEVLDIMNQNKMILVVDEMHKASRELRSDLVSMLKALKTADLEFPTVVLIGTTLDAERLVEPDPGIDRYVKELPVGPLDDDEARYIVDEGFKRLELNISADIREMIVRAAAGAPTIVQAVCLDIADVVVEEGRADITENDYHAAIRLYLNEHGRRLASAYAKAIETMGPRRYRKQILHAMSLAPSDYATLEEIREKIAMRLGERVNSTALSGPLRALKSAEYGGILQDVERYEGGERVYNLTAFKDPMMKAFIRFLGEVEEQGLALADDLRKLAKSF